MRLTSLLLLPATGVYAAGIALRNLAYDRGWFKTHAVGVPVISIGNITVGGTGKTPMAEWLLQYLLSMGKRPAYLSRGYGRTTKGYLRVVPAPGAAEQFGDEAFQVAARFPQVTVAVCEDRVAGAQRLIAEVAPDIIVLDDAFQHRRIHRDLDWVMVDAMRPPQHDMLLPSGRLRESRRALRRAHCVIISKLVDKSRQQYLQYLMQRDHPEVPYALMDLRPTHIQPFDHSKPIVPISDLRRMPVILFSGIGNPSYFTERLITYDAVVYRAITFPDHHPYTPEDMEKILAAVEAEKEIKGKLPPALILTTEKDYFRLKDQPWMQRFAHLPLAFVAVEMEPLVGMEQLVEQLNRILKK